jgi:hypothetical protein
LTPHAHASGSSSTVSKCSTVGNGS